MLTPTPAPDWRVAILISDPIRRYGVEGMIRSLIGEGDLRQLQLEDLSLQPGLDLLLVASADLGSEPTREAIGVLSEPSPKLLLLVDGPQVLDEPWIATVGVQGFLDWAEVEPEVLIDAMSDVMAGKFSMSSSLAQRLVSRTGQSAANAPPDWDRARASLTPREVQVLRLVAEGLSNKQVSRRLKISEPGVKRIVGNVLAKLNAPNRTLAVVRALEDGLLLS